MKFLNNIDLNLNQMLNTLLQLLGTDPASPTEGQIWYNTASKRLKYRDNAGNRLTLTDLTTLADLAAPTGPVSLNGQKITNLGTPTVDTDAVTKAYVDALENGLDVKDSVRLATAAALPTNTYNNGSSGVGATLTATANGALSVDGVAVGVGERILVKDEATQANNGIYTVTAAGGAGAPYVLTRAVDCDTAAEVSGGLFTFIEEGTQADTGWVCTTNGVVTIGTTNLTFGQFSSAGTILADEVTLTKSGSTFSIKSTYAGQTSIVTLGTIGTGVWQGTAVAIGFGGTGASSASGARTNLNVPQRGYVANIGNGTDVNITVTHGLGTEDVAIYVREAGGSKYRVYPDEKVVDTNNVTLEFTVAPTSNQYRVLVLPKE